VSGGGTLDISGAGAVLQNTSGNLSTIGSGTTVNVLSGGTCQNTGSSASSLIIGDTVGGTLNVNGGTVTVQGNFILDNSGSGFGSVTLTNGGTISLTTVGNAVRFGGTGGSGTLNLNGGTLTTPRIYLDNVAVNGTNNFNGGMLQALSGTTSATNFMTGLTCANVRNGGVVIDPNGQNITIGQPLLHSVISGDNATDGGLTIVGTGGSVTLTGTNTYTGPTTINGSVLNLNAPYNAITAPVVGNGGLLEVTASTNSSVLPAITLNNGGGIEFNLGIYNPANVPGITNANLMVSGTNIIDLAGSSIPMTNSVTLLAYTNKTGTSTFVLGTLPAGVAAILTDTGSKLLLNLAVSNTSTMLTLSSGANPSAYGDLLTFQAAISPAPPDGEIITFYDGAATIGTGTIAAGVASFSTAALTVGPHSITAVYSGDASYVGSTSGALLQTVVVAGISAVQGMPQIPNPFLMINWKAVTSNYDSFVFNYGRSGLYLPLITTNLQNPNFILPFFNLPAYVGETNESTDNQAITSMSAVLDASLVGIDKSDQNGTNWVIMMIQYYNHTYGLDVFFNNPLSTLQDFWYQLLPHILFAGLVDRYPATADIATRYSTTSGSASMNDMFFAAANKWYGACQGMGANSNNAPNFNWNGYNFITGQPFTNTWVEPDGAAGVAWLEYMAWRHFGQTNTNFLKAADWSLQFMQNSGSNMLYEVLLPYGALTAVRMNAELGRNYDENKFINWCFTDNSYARSGWGVITGNWGRSDVNGLVGSVTDGGGYAFAMNTFEWAGTLAPVARYDQRFAHDLGKWLLNLANNARLFYSVYVPSNHQASPQWLNGTNNIISYEGLRNNWNGTNLYATGDAVVNGWAATDYAPYGGSYVGIMGALIGSTSDGQIPQIDLLATDYFKDAPFPTYLYYNPHATNATFTVNYGNGTNDILNIVTEQFLRTRAVGAVTLTLPPDTAAVVVVIPSSATIGTQGNYMYANGSVVDYRYAGIDTNGNGLPDWWQTRYFGNLTNASSTATNANGYNNLECFLLGISPFATNVFNLQLSVQPPGGYPQLSWSAIGGKSYSVSMANQFGPTNNWANIYSVTETNVAVGMPGTESYVDSFSAFTSESNRFYRVQLQY
jgi:autotransporter-associated beta strand protein